MSGPLLHPAVRPGMRLVTSPFAPPGSVIVFTPDAIMRRTPVDLAGLRAQFADVTPLCTLADYANVPLVMSPGMRDSFTNAMENIYGTMIDDLAKPTAPVPGPRTHMYVDPKAVRRMSLRRDAVSDGPDGAGIPNSVYGSKLK